jgi:DNA-binding MarR family transcriptional regulator
LTVFDAHGLIERSPDPGDGRRQIISLTPAGAARAEDTALAKEEWLARALQDQFTEDERRIVVQAMSILDRLTQSR